MVEISPWLFLNLICHKLTDVYHSISSGSFSRSSPLTACDMLIVIIILVIGVLEGCEVPLWTSYCGLLSSSRDSGIYLLMLMTRTFSWKFADNMLWYESYHKLLPAKQAKLLQLWDELCIPHEESRQVFGSPLTIIGFNVDPNTMTIIMPDAAQSELLTAL